MSIIAVLSRRRLDFYIDEPSFAPTPQGFDVTVVSRHSQPFVSATKSKAGFAIESAEEAKRVKYGSLCDELGMDFHPMAIDIHGSSGPGFARGMGLIANYISSKRGTCPSTDRRALITQLSSLVLQGTAVSINRRRLHLYAVDG